MAEGSSYLLFLWSPAGYSLREMEGDPPRVGHEFEEGDHTLVVGNRVTGTVNLAQGAFVVLGALAMYSFEKTLGLPPALAALAALGVAAVTGFVLAAGIFAPGLRRPSARSPVPLGW